MSNKPCEIGGGNTNRQIVVGTNDTTVTYCFNSCTSCDKAYVRFQVDMSLQPSVDADGVHIAGTIQSQLGVADWSPDSTMMSDDDGDLVYTLDAILDPGTYNFKYVNGNAWGDDEVIAGMPCASTGGDREITLAAGDNIIDKAYCFATCNTCVLPTMLTLSVDMSNETVSADGVHVAGNFQGWDPAGTALTDMGGNIYSVTVPASPGLIQYKFINGNDWPFEESIPAACNIGNNRELTLGTADTTALTCFSQCTSDCVNDPSPANVSFFVDMTGLTVETSGVWVMGNMTTPAWQAGRTQMQPNATYPDVYETVMTVSGPADFQYKFSNGEPVSGSPFENGEDANLDSLGCGTGNGIGGYNRTFTRSGSNESPGVFCYNTCENCNNVPLSAQVISGERAAIKLYPNPMTNYAVISVPEAFGTKYSMNVYNLTGALVMQRQNQTSRNLLIAKSELQEGVFMIEVTNQAGERSVQRLIVQ